jgi:isoleucyl-tRNA synthetase
MMPTAHAFLALRLSNFDKHTRTRFNASIIFFADWMNSSIRSTEEIWQSMPDEKNDSIFLQEWYQVLDVSYSNKAIDTARAINPFIRKQM